MSQVQNFPGPRKAPVRLADRLCVRLIVREDGAAGFDSEVFPDGRDETVVVAQLRGEAIAEGVRRTISRIASLERSGRAIDSAVLLLSAERSAERLASRQIVTRALFAHMAEHRQGELVISAEDVDADVEDELFALAASLDQEFPRAGVDLKLRVRPARSGPVVAGGIATAAASGGAAA